MSDSSRETPGAVAESKVDPARRKDQAQGLGLLALAFVVSLLVSWRASEAAKPEYSRPPEPPSKEGVVGFPNAVSAIANLERVRATSRRDLLRGFVAEGVGSSGTIDTARPGASLRYVLQSAKGKGPQQEPEPGRVVLKNYCGRQNVHIDSSGVHADPDQPLVGCSPNHDDGLPAPVCSLADVWAKAIERGAPVTAYARVEYYSARGGPAWRFEIPGTTHRFTFTADCRQELQGQDIYGAVP